MKKNKSGLVMLGIVAGLYVVLALMHPDTTLHALRESLGILEMILPIILVVFFLMGLLNLSMDEKRVVKHIGEESGIKGWIIALVGGILSHGPGYVWYPLLQNLREQGAKDGLIVAFIYARSIKLPWIPLMVSYFGWAFTVVYTVYVVIGAFLQGWIVGLFSKK